RLQRAGKLGQTLRDFGAELLQARLQPVGEFQLQPASDLLDTRGHVGGSLGEIGSQLGLQRLQLLEYLGVVGALALAQQQEHDDGEAEDEENNQQDFRA